MGEALIILDDNRAAQGLADAVRRRGLTPRVWMGARPDTAGVQQLKPELILVDAPKRGQSLPSLCQQLKLEPATNLIPIIEVGLAADAHPEHPGFHFSADTCIADVASDEQIDRAIDEVVAWRAATRRDGVAGEFRVCLHSELTYLDELNKLLSQHFRQCGLAEGEAKQVTMAIRELGANAIEWGHRRQVERIVTIHSRLNARKLTIVIRDTGPGFNRCDLPHAASSHDPVSHLSVREELGLREGGFGIMIAGGLVDELRYNESGNEVCLVKYLTSREGSPQKPSP